MDMTRVVGKLETVVVIPGERRGWAGARHQSHSLFGSDEKLI